MKLLGFSIAFAKRTVKTIIKNSDKPTARKITKQLRVSRNMVLEVYVKRVCVYVKLKR